MGAQLHLWGDDDPPDGLRWSLSRDRRLRECLRKYYLFHYASRGGANGTGSPDARELWVLRSLRNRYMWVGEVVHEMIERCLSAWNRQEEAPLDALIDRGTRTMRAHYAESLQGVYRERPNSAVGLVEHEYREPIAREEWQRQRDHMERCLRNFYGLEITAQVRAMPRWRWLALESGGRFELGGAQIAVKPDFAWRDTDDRVVMVDWKTGLPRPEDEALQLAVYGLFARRSWGLGAAHMRAITAYLATGEVREFRVDLDDLRAAEATITTSLERMRALVKRGLSEDADAFPMTEERASCALCGFRRVCGR